MTETGDRGAFLRRLRNRLAAGVPENPAHPRPSRPSPLPIAVPRQLDREDLVASFTRAATAVNAEVHRVHGPTVPEDLLGELVARHGVRRAVRTTESAVDPVAAELARMGVDVMPLSIDNAADADLGLTSATYGIAATGSLVVEADVAGGRSASLLPPTHLCVLPVSRLVATTDPVLRDLGRPGRLPSNVVLITGPSRSGDIEQIITLGVHGPTVVHIVLTDE